MSDVLVEVHGTYVLADGTPAAGSVLLTPVAVAGMSAAVKRLVTRHSVVGRLDGQGSVTLHVLASDDPDWMVDGPVLYEVAEYIAGARGKAYQVHIPGPGPVDLADLQPVDEPQTVAAFPVPGPRGQQGPPGIGIRILSAVPTVADLPAVGEDGDAHLVIESGDLWVWGTDGAWHDSGHVQGPPGPPGDVGTLNDLTDVDTTRDATGMVITRQPDGTYKGQHVRVSLNQLTDVTAPSATPPNSLLGTVGEGATAGQAEWEPLHLDYVQQVVLGPLPSSVADLSQRVTELEHTGEVVPPDLELTVDLYSGSFTRIMGCDPITASPSQRIRLTLATTPGPNGTVFADLAGISGTGAVWADFGGVIGKVVDTSGTSINGASLKEAIRRGQIVTVHRGTDGTHPTLVVEKVENPADTGSSLTLDALRDVTAPANTPIGKVLGTTAVGEWGPIDAPGGLPSPGSPRPGGSWTYNGVGAATAPGEIKVNSATTVTTLRVNPLDSAGTDWSAQIDALQVGDIITMTQAGPPIDLRVRGAINTSGSRNIPVDSVSASALTQGGTVRLEFPPATPSASPGDVLTLDGTLAPVWRSNAISGLDSLSDVTAPADTPPYNFLGTTAVGTWGPLPNPVPPIDQNDDGKVLTVSGPTAVWTESASQADIEALQIFTAASIGLWYKPEQWEARSYSAGYPVIATEPASTDYGIWVAQSHADPVDVPGISPKWQRRVIPDDAPRWKSWSGTQAQYDAIAVKDPQTLYAITG
jgi:hypothetical protein